jgi:1-acyl-sn-glycerol-3-phosphate acyltransferase
MSSLRAAARLAAAAPVTAFCYTLALSSTLLLAPWPKARSRGQGLAFRIWSRSLCRLFGVRVAVEGPPPAPPFVLVSNHTSYLDILALGTELPCVFVAKAEIDGWPLFGALCRSVNTIFIDRKSKRRLPEVIARIEEKLEAHQGVVIFPEGTSGPGHAVLPFRSSLLDLPARIGRPVHWAALTYRAPEEGPPTHLAVTWWGEMPLGPHLWGLLRLPRIEARLRFGAAPVAAEDRKVLAETLWREIDAVFEPMADPEEIARLERLRATDPDQVPPILRPKPGAS